MAELKNFPGPEPNSDVYRESKAKEGKEQSKVKAKVKEKTFKQKCKEAIIAEDVGDIKEYAILKVLIPNIKKMVRSALLGMFDMRFFGKSMGNGSGAGKLGGQIVDYAKHSSDIWSDSDELQRKADEKSGGGASLRISELSNVQFNTEEETANILRYLRGIVAEYGVASVSDFIEKSGLRANNTHRKWGWYDLDNATIELDDDTDMYYIRFPRPKGI